MNRWLRVAESTMPGKANIRWNIQHDIASDPVVKDILADLKMTRSEKAKQITERVGEMLEDQVPYVPEGIKEFEVVGTPIPERDKIKVDDKDVEEVIYKHVEKELDGLSNNFYDQFTRLNIDANEARRIADQLIGDDDDGNWEKILKENKVEIDATLADMLKQYEAIIK